MASISVVDAAREAAEHTRRHLVPVNPLKWLTLGFLAFLDQCGRTLAGGGPQGRSGGNLQPWHGSHGVTWDGPDFHRLGDVARTVSGWLSDHAVLVTLGSALGILAIAALLALILWINARGTFMYLDNVASGRGDVVRPWNEHAGAAWSYFGWRFALSFGSLLVFLMVTTIVLTSVLGFFSGRFDTSAGGLTLLALVPMVVVLLLSVPLLALAHVALRDFVAPLQMLTGLSCGSAARLLEALVTEHPGAFLVYLLLKLLLVVVTGIVVLVGGCLTCCIAFLPVVKQTVFQPLYYFERSWPLFLLRRMGHDLPGRWAA
jgi:hypothetical protein